MSSLATLPRELRDQIFTELAEGLLPPIHERPCLEGPLSKFFEHREEFENPYLESPQYGYGTFYMPGTPFTNCNSLILVNKFLHNEALDNLKQFEPKLDVILLYDKLAFFPTWIVPVMRPKIKKLTMTFRVAGSYHFSDYDADYPYVDIHRSTTLQSDLGLQVLGILERIFKVGSKGECCNEDEHRHCIIKKLCIDVEVLLNTHPELIDQYSELLDILDRGFTPGKILDPQAVAGLINGHLHRITGYGSLSNGQFRYGRHLFEHVDEIVVSQDGKEIKKIDIAKRLERIQEGVDDFWKCMNTPSGEQLMMEGIWQLRRERGLKGRAERNSG